jgi:hypothetical protein
MGEYTRLGEPGERTNFPCATTTNRPWQSNALLAAKLVADVSGHASQLLWSDAAKRQ